MDRRLFIVIAVVGFHVLGLWALQTGLLRRAVELVVPVQVMVEFIELPQPQVTPTPPPPQPQPAPVPKRVTPPAPRPAPQPVAIADPTPSPTAATGITEPQPPAPPPQTPMVVAEPAPPAPPKIELPSSSADYLNNAPPPYPPLSKRLGEQGKVTVRAFIEVNGTASKAEIRTSSGYERLDQTALQTVLKWRYIPGKRAGVPEAMWFNIPINFVLE
ncbi:MAG TPA: energy transducer TonB [Hydrogenophaga sp.]|jgi:protein TonB|uniref:energy transducer TonB n=1 Tax=Hydrogenophaga sp. TaxID=1904254 RepID=UPI0008D3A1A5|nr:energy transducer TonB [Hydrogenophaga sp.]OGA79387.1 MAG: energy transducer TonB [Burkholderiales bacterium GWE1_65_30]OGA92957.1 MAG: energy transducer TonB [Burkholderiales bacterium GWF1_66_17]OGB30408.1 MAG: energy transducer TonB [Burkholderiales bacterium RIFCSPLOWO2_02_FULL_66_35]OGB36844.1 MAG: energy transducer TonB [Burkholderiales bacterium RIFCSPHIGHO2_02_FULL_66_10]MDZ4279149.1 energy transducer TonB [Hydrogenophaga sp.]